MNTDIEYLRRLEADLQDVGARERARAVAPPARRRPSLGWGSVAVAIVPILVVAGLIGWLVTAGGGSFNTSGAGASLADLGVARRAVGPGMPSSTSAPVDAGPVAGAVGNASETGPATDLSKIVRDGSISVEVPKDDFQKGFAAVTRIADSNGGFVLSSQTRGQRSGTLTLRIPAKRFDQAMLALRDVGLVQAASVTGKDVTAEFVDLKARLQNAIAQRAALRALMARATTIAETLTVQNRLSAVQLQIEQIQGQLRYIANQVSESTIRVELHERNAPRPKPANVVENPSLGTAWDRGIQGLLNVVAAVVVGLGYLIPLGVLALAAWLITLAVRRRRATG